MKLSYQSSVFCHVYFPVLWLPHRPYPHIRHTGTKWIQSVIDYITQYSIFNFTNIYGFILKMFHLWLQIVLIVYLSKLIRSRRLIVVILLELEPPLWLLWNIRLDEIFLDSFRYGPDCEDYHAVMVHPPVELFIKSRLSCQKGPTRHANAWQIGPFWQDTLEMKCWK